MSLLALGLYIFVFLSIFTKGKAANLANVRLGFGYATLTGLELEETSVVSALRVVSDVLGFYELS